MSTYTWVPFIIGIAGSVHCVGMCGPLILHFTPFQTGKFAINAWLYHSGRLIAYMLLGLIIGLIGTGLNMIGIQKYVSFVLGFLILLFFLSEWLWKLNFLKNSAFIQTITHSLSIWQQWIYNTPSLRKTFFFGFANGLIPCGLVYLALAGAMAEKGVAESMVYMLLFGLGTWPALLLVSFFGSKVRLKSKATYQYASFAITICVSILLMYKGLHSFEIPKKADQTAHKVCK